MRRLLPLAALAVLLLLAACSSSEEITSREIVSHIPWSGADAAKYRVLDSNDEQVGALDLTVEPQPDGTLLLHQYFDFPDKKFTNEAKVIVDASTLQPKSSSFKIVGPQGNLDCSATYANGQVSAHRIGEDTTRDDTIDVPRIVYDSWGDLFVWRTLDFAKDFEIDYADVLSCTLDKTQEVGVKLNVTDQESVTVPAGTFDTWKMEIHSGGETQTAWYSTDARHTLIRYDNGTDKFELIIAR
jgi:hypothetical protein